VPESESLPPGAVAGGIVGRDSELRALRIAFDEAVLGRVQLRLLSGEPGIGKTRTAQELATYVKARGSQVTWGRCYQYGGAPVFWPWVQILRAGVEAVDADALRAALGSAAPDVAQLLPQLRQRLPDLRPAVGLHSAEARFRLFEGVARFLVEMAREAPLVIILDDLQGADEPSLRLLQFLVRELRDAPILLAGAFRDVALSCEHPFTATLAELLREPNVQQLALNGLSAAEVGRFIEAYAGVTPAIALSAVVHERTGGNPLFLTELVRVLAAEGAFGSPAATRLPIDLPGGLRAVIQQRLSTLSPQCARALSAASVIGRQFRFDVLAASVEAPAATLLDASREAVRARLLLEVPGAPLRYRFAHALIREALYEELGGAQRIVLHRRVAEAIERLSESDEHLAQLAYHFFEAGRDGDNDKAVLYAQRAGDRALALLAYEEAVRRYDAGLYALDRYGGKSPPAPFKTRKGRPSREQQRYELLMARGRAQQAIDVAGAKQTFQHAAEVARKMGAPEALGRAVLGIADWRPLEAADASVVSLLAEAVAASGDADSPLRARLLGRLAMELSPSDQRERRTALARQAVEIARRVGEAAALAHALLALHVADCGPDNAAERLAIATEMVRAAHQAGETDLMLQGRMCRIVDYLELGDGAALDNEIETFRRHAEMLRQPRYLSWSAHFLAVRATYQGCFEESERWASEMTAQAQRGQERAFDGLFAGEMFALRSTQGRLAELEAAMKALGTQIDSRQGDFEGVRCGLAAIYSESGRAAEAKFEFEHFAANQFASLPRDGFWLNSLACLVRACAFLGDVERAAVLYDLLLPYDGRAVSVSHPGTLYDGAVAHYLGVLAAMMSRWEAARRHFEDGLVLSERLGARPHVARTQYEYAAMLLTACESTTTDGPPHSQPDVTKAHHLLNHSLATAQELGMQSLAEKAQCLLAVHISARAEEAASFQRPSRSPRSSLSTVADAEIHAPPAALDPRRKPAAMAGQQIVKRGEAVFHREGDYWTLAYSGSVLRVKDSKGVHWIAELLRYPGREFLALDLVMQAHLEPGGRVRGARSQEAEPQNRALPPYGNGPLLDTQAREAYRHRLEELREVLAEAEQFNDLGRATRVREEIDLVTEQLVAAIGLGGRDRGVSSQAERARQTVTKGIKSVIAKIRAANPALARHLAATIATGYFCVYLPDPDVIISWFF
jgi:AAA ATPase domain